MPVESATNAASPAPNPRGTGAIAWALRSAITTQERHLEECHRDLARALADLERASRGLRNTEAALTELRTALAAQEA